MMEQIIAAEAEQNGNAPTQSAGLPVSISDEVFEAFDERLEELFWREDDAGVLLVGDDEFNPDTVAEFALTAGRIEAELVEMSSREWQQNEIVSRPGTVASNQFD
jgi:hypothetical protein